MGDPTLFLIWLLNSIRNATKDHDPALYSIITRNFIGELEIREDSASEPGKPQCYQNDKITTTPFLILSVELPPTPLFKDAYDRMQISQVPLYKLLKKYDSETLHKTPGGRLRRYRLTRLPNFLILS